eukprot:768259-Hanusia_phi.AAC.3
MGGSCSGGGGDCEEGWVFRKYPYIMDKITGIGGVIGGPRSGMTRAAWREAEEAAMGWEEAANRGRDILLALSNASSRIKDFEQARGRLGVLSSVKTAEDRLLVMLGTSVERLVLALRSIIVSLQTSCSKLEKAVDDALIDMANARNEESKQMMAWEAEHGQPVLAEMVEWLEDALNSMKRENALREMLVDGISYAENDGVRRAIELWNTDVFFNLDEFRKRADSVRIHAVA